MAKKSADANTMEGLHALLAKVFTKSLKSYEAKMAIVDAIDPTAEIDQELIEKLIGLTEPSPAMLSAVSKFLKDNEIMYTADEVDELTSQQRRLNEMAKRRSHSVSLDNLKLVDGE